MDKKLSRREILRALAAVAGRLSLGMLSGCAPSLGHASEQDGQRTYLPLVGSPPASLTPGAPQAEPSRTPFPAPPSSRVVHVRSAHATSWDFGNAYYGHYVDQAAVTTMMDQGVMTLTGASSPARAWQTLVPDYSPGKAIAIKVNFNNCRSCRTDDLAIDALIQPVNAIVEGLRQAYPDFSFTDVWVYEASGQGDFAPRQIPMRFMRDCRYSGVRFFDTTCNEKAGYTRTDASAVVTWRTPPGLPAPPRAQVTDVLVKATYVINMPIMKRHGGTGVTLSFKNHFGSIEHCQPLHAWVYPQPWGNYYSGTTYSPLVDLYRNVHIAGKTVLVVGDALFGNWEDNNTPPRPWSTFGHAAPNSLLFATDPVAVDCVMCDLLDAEQRIESMSDDYLVYAHGLELGTYERGDPHGTGYKQIDYVPVSM